MKEKAHAFWKRINYNIETCTVTASRIRQLVENGAIEALCPMLDRADAKVRKEGKSFSVSAYSVDYVVFD